MLNNLMKGNTSLKIHVKNFLKLFIHNSTNTAHITPNTVPGTRTIALNKTDMTTMRYQVMPIRMDNIKKTRNSKCW